MTKVWLTTLEVADLLGVHRATVRRWANSNPPLIQSAKTPSGQLRFRPEWVEEAQPKEQTRQEDKEGQPAT